jgi:hypothetical protein
MPGRAFDQDWKMFIQKLTLEHFLRQHTGVDSRQRRHFARDQIDYFYDVFTHVITLVWLQYF